MMMQNIDSSHYLGRTSGVVVPILQECSVFTPGEDKGQSPERQVSWTVVLAPAMRTDPLREVVPVEEPGTRLELFVSRDEEYVRGRLRRGDELADLRSRNHNSLLLLLARARLEDEREGTIPEAERGWVYRDDIERMLKINKILLSVWIHRACTQLDRTGLVDSSRVIQRRSSVGQLRLGLGDIAIREA